MMSEPKNTGGCAFPFAAKDYESDPGMSLRDWFAGMAMLGIYANPTSTDFKQAEIAAVAYRAADLMLEVREQ